MAYAIAMTLPDEAQLQHPSMDCPAAPIEDAEYREDCGVETLRCTKCGCDLNDAGDCPEGCDDSRCTECGLFPCRCEVTE